MESRGEKRSALGRQFSLGRDDDDVARIIPRLRRIFNKSHVRTGRRLPEMVTRNYTGNISRPNEPPRARPVFELKAQIKNATPELSASARIKK